MVRSFAQGPIGTKQHVTLAEYPTDDHGNTEVTPHLDNEEAHGCVRLRGAAGHGVPVPETRSEDKLLLIGPPNAADLSLLPEREICFRAGIPSPANYHVQMAQRASRGILPQTRYTTRQFGGSR